MLGIQEQVNFIIGVGGGSPLDAAKAIGIMISNKDLEIDELIGGNLKSIPIIAVPTTAGTGSETTQYAILTDHKAKTKINMGHSVFPKVAFLDATYMMDIPASITITEKEIETYTQGMCSNAGKLKNHPEEVGYEEIYKIYKESFIL